MAAWGLSWPTSRALLIVLGTLALSPCRSPKSAQLVVGVQSEPMGGQITSLHVVARVDGVVAVDETVQPQRGVRIGFPTPWESTLRADGRTDAKVDVMVEAFGGEGPAPLLTRLASTHLGASPTLELLRVPLEARCVVHPPTTGGPGKIPGPLSGPTCTPPATCILGACQSSQVPPGNLEPYATNWPGNAPDRCKPRGAGAPILQVGTGQTDYLPVVAGQTLQAEAGPQGGHHIWIATRMKNLKQTLTTTRIEGVQPGTGLTIPPSTFVFTYAPSEGGYCKLYGLRYQLDNGGIDYKPFLGKPLDVTVTVTDPAGSTTQTTAHVTVAPTLVGTP